MQNVWRAGERKMIIGRNILGVHSDVPETAEETQTVR